MTDLKKKSVARCFSMLREFVDEADSRNGKKANAMLALDQLQRITAGAIDDAAPGSPGLPGSFGEVGLENACIDHPRAG